MPKVSLAIKSCHRYADRRQACLDTWLKDWPYNFVFLVGQPTKELLPYCLMIESSDSFSDIAPKVQAACKWALNQNSDYLVICDDDTYLIPERLLKSGFEKHDYVGFVRPYGDISNGNVPYMQGSCYILSAQAIEFVAHSNEMRNGIIDDGALGRALINKVPFTHDWRFQPGPECCIFPQELDKATPSNGSNGLGYLARNNTTISVHKVLPNIMFKIHEEWKKEKIL